MESEFKVPIPRRRKREQVLEEDEYLNKLYQIIERDYFPDKKKLKALNDLLEAEDTHDERLIAKMRRRLIQVNAGESGASTPDTLAGSELQEENRETLDKFLRKFTTEDNKSFEKIQEENKQRLRLKYWWAFQDSKQNKQTLSIEGPKPLLAIEQGSNTQLNNCPYTALSNFYYHPENYQNTLATLAEFEDFRGPPKEIKRENTRLDAEFLISQEELAHRQATPNLNQRGELMTPHILDPSEIPITWGEVESTPLILHEDKRFKVILTKVCRCLSHQIKNS